MKRILQPERVLRAALFVLLLSVVGMTKAFAAYDFSAVCETGQTLYYTITDAENHYVKLTCPGSGTNGYYSWTGFTKPVGDIVLPGNVQYDGVSYILTSIGDYAFFDCSGLTGTLNIPNSVISIGKCAFDNCRNLTGSLIIPNSVTSIGIEAFGKCEGFTSITIPNSVISIDNWAFCYCNISYLTIPNSVISIGDFAFAYCRYLSSLSIGNSVTSIGKFAFSLCSRLSSVFIPNSVTSIGENPFDQCSSLGQIVVESGNSAYDSRNNCNAIIDKSTNCLITGCKNTIIPNTVTSIGDNAFRGCTGLTGTLTIPNSVTSIGFSAFSACYNMTGTLVIPNSVTIIGDSAFDGCTRITGELIIPSSVVSIGEYAFVRCRGIEQIVVDPGNPIYDSRDNCNAIILTSINRLVSGCKNTIIPNSVTSIGSQAFSECSDMTSIIIPNSVISIGNQAFSGCSNLITMTIGSSITTIGLQSFNRCTNLESITVLAETPPSLYSNLTFQGCPKSIPVYVSCESVEAYTTANWGGFNNFIGFCGGTVSVAANPEEGGTVTGGGVFGADEACTVMATENEEYSFSIWTQNGRRVSNNTEYTFYVSGEMDLVAHFVPNANITFADSNVKAICISHWDTDGDGELSYVEAAVVSNLCNYFRNNSMITSFDELQYFIGLALIGGYEFSGCTGLTSIEIPSSVTSIGKTAFQSCSSLTSIEIPNSVTSIGSSAFQSCSSLTSIEIPNSVTSIGSSAFQSCSSLTSIEIPNAVTSIGSSAFRYCSSLTSIEIPNSVTSIGSSAFQSCSSLTSIEIPNSVTSIGSSAFQYCRGLTSMTVLAENPPTLGSVAFAVVNKSIPVHVPCGSSEAYQNADGWNEFTNIQESCPQTVSLSEGWNWFSTYIEAEDLLEQLEEVLGENGLQIKNDSISTEYDSEWGWFGDLDEVGFTNEEMIMIKTAAACTVELEGTPAIPAIHPITINPGWNWIGYPCAEEMTLEEAFYNFTPEVDDKIKNSEGTSEYDAEWGWFGDVETLVPGQGFMYYSASTVPKTLVFQVGRKK